MKRFLNFIVFTALALVLVACGGGQKTHGVRVFVPTATVKSISMELRVTINDPNKKLEEDSVVLTLTGPNNYEQKVDGVTTAHNLKLNFTDLIEETEYKFTVTGVVDEKVEELYTVKYETKPRGEFEENPILVETVEDFLAMRGTNQEGKHRLYYKQTADLDFEGESLQSLFSSGRSFSGGYDGNGFAIKNLNMNVRADVNRAYPSIFGYVSSAKIQNLVLDNVKYDNTEADNAVYTGSLYVGLLVSKISTNNAIIDNITIKNSGITIRHNSGGSSTSRNTYVGLLIGAAQGTVTNITIENSTIDAESFGSNRSVSATDGTFIGGAIGLVELERSKVIENIFVDAQINLKSEQHRANTQRGNIYLGGVIGSHRGGTDINGVAFGGSLTFSYEAHDDSEFLDTILVGGLVGQIKRGSLYDGIVTAAITIDLLSEVDNSHFGTFVGLSDFSGNRLVAAETLTLTAVEELSVIANLYNFSRPNDWNPNAFLRTQSGKVIVNTVEVDLTDVLEITEPDYADYFNNEALIDYLS